MSRTALNSKNNDAFNRQNSSNYNVITNANQSIFGPPKEKFMQKVPIYNPNYQ